MHFANILLHTNHIYNILNFLISQQHLCYATKPFLHFANEKAVSDLCQCRYF